MEGVKSKKEYMERNRRIFQEKIATREVKDDLYDDLGRFWFEDDGRTWIMDLRVIYMLLSSTFGYMFCKIIPSCFHMKSAPADPDEDGHQRTGPDVEADTEAKKTQVDPELYLPAQRLVAVGLIKAVNYHVKDFVQSFVIVYPLVRKYDEERLPQHPCCAPSTNTMCNTYHSQTRRICVLCVRLALVYVRRK